MIVKSICTGKSTLIENVKSLKMQNDHDDCVCMVTHSCRLTPLSMGFSRQEYWSGLPFPPLGDFPNSGIQWILVSWGSCIVKTLLFIKNRDKRHRKKFNVFSSHAESFCYSVRDVWFLPLPPLVIYQVVSLQLRCNSMTFKFKVHY